MRSTPRGNTPHGAVPKHDAPSRTLHIAKQPGQPLGKRIELRGTVLRPVKPLGGRLLPDGMIPFESQPRFKLSDERIEKLLLLPVRRRRPEATPARVIDLLEPPQLPPAPLLLLIATAILFALALPLYQARNARHDRFHDCRDQMRERLPRALDPLRLLARKPCADLRLDESR